MLARGKDPVVNDLGGLHRAPFDRMLAAQALIENMTLVSNEKAFDAYAVKRLW